MSSKKFLVLSGFLLVACTSSPQASSKSEATAPAPAPAAPAVVNAQPQPATAAALTRVEDPSTVCMINDQHMGVAQIPVQVEGKTYYGCCEMCEQKLKNNPEARLGTDPVTQKAVDKATAVLAKDAKGKVLYFESEDSMRTYAARM